MIVADKVAMIENASMARYTTFKIGGPAREMIFPKTADEVASWLATGDISFVMGGGANLLVSDDGIDGVVMNLADKLTSLRITESAGKNIVHAGAGWSMTKLAGFFMKKGISGFEFAYGIPGTVGGAIVMNAGTNMGEMKDVVTKVTVATEDGELSELNADQLGFVYRGSSLPKGAVVTEVTMRLPAGESGEIHHKMREGFDKRKLSQPLNFPSAGSIFKNPQGDYAGRIIEACDLKGARVGQAVVSHKHANFIVNEGGATASEVYRLIRRIEESVYERFGARLEREIKLVGKFLI